MPIRFAPRFLPLFSMLMIFIACLGIIGSCVLYRRTTHQGNWCSQNFGSRDFEIVLLLTRNFVLLVALASIPAFIGAWYFMNKWLDTFSYHATLNYWLFALSLVVVIIITLMTTGYHAFKAAVRNPIHALRDE